MSAATRVEREKSGGGVSSMRGGGEGEAGFLIDDLVVTVGKFGDAVVFRGGRSFFAGDETIGAGTQTEVWEFIRRRVDFIDAAGKGGGGSGGAPELADRAISISGRNVGGALPCYTVSSAEVTTVASGADKKGPPI